MFSAARLLANPLPAAPDGPHGIRVGMAKSWLHNSETAAAVHWGIEGRRKLKLWYINHNLRPASPEIPNGQKADGPGLRATSELCESCAKPVPTTWQTRWITIHKLPTNPQPSHPTQKLSTAKHPAFTHPRTHIVHNPDVKITEVEDDFPTNPHHLLLRLLFIYKYSKKGPA